MGVLTELKFKLPSPDEHLMDNNAPLEVPSTTLRPTFYNFMESFEQNDATDIPEMCKLHMPTWLNLWCVTITMCIVVVLIVLGVLVHYVQRQRHRQTVTGSYAQDHWIYFIDAFLI